MNVGELLLHLRAMPTDAEVWYIWDGVARSKAEFVWLSKDGRVMICDPRAYVYLTEERPNGAPTQQEDRFWKTPEEDGGGLLSKFEDDGK